MRGTDVFSLSTSRLENDDACGAMGSMPFVGLPTILQAFLITLPESLLLSTLKKLLISVNTTVFKSPFPKDCQVFCFGNRSRCCNKDFEGIHIC